MEFVNAQPPQPQPSVPASANKIMAFSAAAPTSMVILRESLLEHDLPNLQIALDHFLTGPERFAEQVQYIADHEPSGFGLATVRSSARWQPIAEGPVQHRSVELAAGQRLLCMEKGLAVD